MDEQSRIFNYRLSRFRRVSENAFSILSSRFRMFLQRINLGEENVRKATKAGCVLHNMFCELCLALHIWPVVTSYMASGYVDHEDPLTGEIIEGEWRKSVPSPSNKTLLILVAVERPKQRK